VYHGFTQNKLKGCKVISQNVSAVEETLRSMIIKITHNENVSLTRDTTFKKLGVDSLNVVRILVSIEDAYDIDLEDDELKDIKDMGNFIDYLKIKIESKHSGS
jgi:acyl carrier protein